MKPSPQPKLTVISLGWGVQSFTMAAMSALGELPKIDFAIHADTMHESQATYAFVEKWSPWFEDKNVSVKTVKNPMGNALAILAKPGQTHIPLFTLSPAQKYGQLNRSCTQRWKIAPMRKAIRWYLASMGISNPKPGTVEQWIGISLDEVERMRRSDVKYIVNRWPLVEKRMTRNDCANWLLAHGLEVPPKSACVFCPFHNREGWRKVKACKHDWDEAVAIDKAFRDVRMNARKPVKVFVHPQRIPLEQVDLTNEVENGQMELFEQEECSGTCFV